MIKKIIYLDNNATTATRPEVIKAMADVMRVPNNASSVHSFGREAKKLVSEARQKVAKFAGAEGAEVIFTSSGTESNSLAVKGFKSADYILISAVEHLSIIKPAQEKEASIIPVDENGVVKIDALRRMLKNTPGKALVSVQLANNETGVIQPVKEIAEVVYANGGHLHCDAVQASGKIKVDFNRLNTDMMTVSAHKFGGPQGAAALIIKKGIEISAIQTGGGQEKGFRAGTENVPAIVGFGVAAELAERINPELRDYMEKKLKAFASDITIFGENSARLPNTSCFSAGNMNSETQVIALDLAGVAVSNGSACSSGKVSASHVLSAMGVDKEKASKAIRVSLSHETTREEIDGFLVSWKENYKKGGFAQAA